MNANVHVASGDLDKDPELANIQQMNPDAYAMVKGLLLKKSMGLIKSRDSTSYDESSAEDSDLPPAPKGPVNMFSWKPKDSAADLVEEDPSVGSSSYADSDRAEAPAKKDGPADLSSYLGVHFATAKAAAPVEQAGWHPKDPAFDLLSTEPDNNAKTASELPTPPPANSVQGVAVE